MGVFSSLSAGLFSLLEELKISEAAVCLLHWTVGPAELKVTGKRLSQVMHAHKHTHREHNYSHLTALGNPAASSMRCCRTIWKMVFSSNSKGVTKVQTPSSSMTYEHGHTQREKIISRTKRDKRKPPQKYTQVTKIFLKCECACNAVYTHSHTEQ